MSERDLIRYQFYVRMRERLTARAMDEWLLREDHDQIVEQYFRSHEIDKTHPQPENVRPS